MSNHTALVQDLFSNITREGWSTKFNDALADDLVWVATGSSPVAGTYEGKQVYLEKIIKRLGDRLQSWPKPVAGVGLFFRFALGWTKPRKETLTVALA